MPFSVRLLAAVVASLTCGCSLIAPGSAKYPNGMPPPTPILFANPSFVAAPSRDLFWDQVVDVVDDYFTIDHEERVRLVGDVLTEGRIDTFPQGGATLLEPHRHDSVGTYNRIESTLQTIRRFAVVRAIPTEGGYLIDVAVYKELEDRPQPDRTPAGSATFIAGNTTAKGREIDLPPDPAERGWISQGRDAALEQRILGEILNRAAAPTVQSVRY